MMDLLERLEAAAEAKYDELYIDEETFRCSCGQIERWEYMQFVDPNPYSEPVCRSCMDEYCEKITRQE